jgi:peptidoglycan hydrolase-like protein with peptidoglycan-binding domain
MVSVMSRAQWGAIGGRGSVGKDRRNRVIIHTSVTPNGGGTVAGETTQVRGMERFHVQSRKWDGIAYSFLVGNTGTIFEGRGWGRNGAHTQNGGNSQGYAWCVVGDGTRQQPSDAAVQAIRDHIALGIQEGHIDPAYIVSGHHDWYPSKPCPGSCVYGVMARLTGVRGGGVMLRPVQGQSGRAPITTGDGGNWVRTWQQQLNDTQGEKLAVDGKFGPGTEAATRRFQAKHGLTADGIVGPKTIAAMDAVYRQAAAPPASAGGVMRRGATGALVRTWQQQLVDTQGAKITVDGDFGPGTEAATRAFQAKHGLTADGIVGPKTIAAMEALYRPVPAPVIPPPAPVPVAKTGAVLRRGDNNSSVRVWQQQLVDTQGERITVDGDFGPATEAATKRFQSKSGLAADGIVGPDTINAMHAVYAARPQGLYAPGIARPSREPSIVEQAVVAPIKEGLDRLLGAALARRYSLPLVDAGDELTTVRYALVVGDAKGQPEGIQRTVLAGADPVETAEQVLAFAARVDPETVRPRGDPEGLLE